MVLGLKLFVSSFFLGGPVKCGDKVLPQNFTCNPNAEISGNVTLCGKPQPTLSWIVGDQTFNGSIDQTSASKHQYTYSFSKRIDSGMCGKSISYKATGFGNNIVNGLSLILMESCKFKIAGIFQ